MTRRSMRTSHSMTMSRRAFAASTAGLAASAASARAFAAPHAGAPTIERWQSTDKVSLSAIKYVYGTPPPVDGPGMDAISTRFNADYSLASIPEATYTEKLTAVIASGDIPDAILFKTADPNFYRFAEQGAFLKLDDLLPNYESFKLVPESTLNNTRVGGEVFALPSYYPPFSLTPSIRQDWLDNLGLKMPTSYEELKQVAVAFTEGDPSGTGKDCYGIAMGELINPAYALGAWWDPAAWYHKDGEGRLIPGSISDAGKERIQFLADLFTTGAVTRDFAVLDWATTNNEFYSGKAGIFIGAPRGMSEDYYASLIAIQPDANPVPIPPFKSPDGAQGYLAAPGFSGMVAISAKLAGDDTRLQRLLEFIDFGRSFFTPEQSNPDNPDFDWLRGGVGVGYEMVEGKAVSLDNTESPKGLAPTSYLIDNIPWPPDDNAIDYSLGYGQQPAMGAWAKQLQEMWGSTRAYVNPSNGIISETAQKQGADIDNWLVGEQTKMIAGQRGMETWGELVSEYLSRGGEDIISEINAGITERDSAS